MIIRTREARARSVAGFAAAIATVAGLAMGASQPRSARTETAHAAEPRSANRAARSLEPTSIDPPAPPGSTSPALAAERATTSAKGHDILLTWLAPDPAGGRLTFARLSEQVWTEPITVAERVSRLGSTDRPSLTVIDTRAVRRTLIARTGDVVARSGDAGRTWTRLPAAALPFASFAGGDEGAYAFWLDADGDGPTQLLGTRVLAGKTLLDPHVAGGPGTSAAMTWDGPVVVYRDESGADAHDIAIIRRQDGQWTESRPVHAEGWSPALEPKGGPQVAALQRQLAVAWYTEASNRPRVVVVFSRDAGRTFGDPVDVNARDQVPSGPLDIALDDDGDALVVWTATTSSTEATLNLARVSPNGDQGERLVLTRRHPRSLENIPQIARAGNRVAVAWTEGIFSRVRAVAVPIEGIPAPANRQPEPAVTSANAPTPLRGRGRVGDSVPDLELVSLDGDQVSLTSLRGRAVLLNMWATWCLPCIAEMPELAELHERYGPAGLVVVGTSIDSTDAADKVRAFVSERRIPFAVWLDPEMRVADALRVHGVPATFIIDRSGRILFRQNHAIAADDPELRQALNRALNGS